MRGKKKLQTQDFIGWKSITNLNELRLPNRDRCSHKCCEGIGRRVEIKLSKESSSKKLGTVTHLNSRRAIVEIDREGEIIVTKEMMPSILMYQDDIEERKMRLSAASKSIEKDRPSLLQLTNSDDKEEDFDSVEDFD
jgi:hypothetical protein